MKDMFETFETLATKHAVELKAQLRQLAEVTADPQASAEDREYVRGEAIRVRDNLLHLCNVSIVAAQTNQNIS